MIKKLAKVFHLSLKRLEENNESTKKLGEVNKKTDVEDGDNQTPAVQNITSTQSLRDTLAFMKKSKIFFNKVETPMEMCYGIIYLLNYLEKKNDNKNVEDDTTPNIQKQFPNAILSSKFLDTDRKKD